MHRIFISTVIAAALTVTGISATMAQAGEYRRAPQINHKSRNSIDPIAATIAGVAALVILGNALGNNAHTTKKADHPKQKVEHHRPSNRDHASNHRNGGHRAHGHDGHRNKHRHNGRRSHNTHRSFDWHRHGNGRGHKHAHRSRHHRGHH